MSHKHKLILLAAVVAYIAVSIPVVLSAVTLAGTLANIVVGVLIAAAAVGFAELWNRHEISEFSVLRPRYFFPVTAQRMAHNQQILAEDESSALRAKAHECASLARSYRSREEPYQAELLEVQSDHYKRMAAVRREDAERIQRELEDRKMAELTR